MKYQFLIAALALGACSDNGGRGERGAKGAQGVAGEAGPQGPQGLAGLDGAKGDSCSVSVSSGALNFQCLNADNQVTSAVSVLLGGKDEVNVPVNFKNSVFYATPLKAKNVSLPSSVVISSLAANIGSGANGRITLKVNGVNYCYQSSVGSKTFNFVGQTAAVNCNSGAVLGSAVRPTGFDLESLEILLEHRSDLASRWLLNSSITVTALDNADLDLE